MHWHYLSTIFSKVFRYANPARRTRMFSCSPRYLIWCRMALESYSVGDLLALGLIVRMYEGCDRINFSTSALAEDYSTGMSGGRSQE